jgi:4-alpha-glucanotransferase
MPESSTLDRLAALAGIEPYYYDIRGHRQDLTPDSTRALLVAMGFRVETESDRVASLSAFETSSWRCLLDSVSICSASYGGEAAIFFNHAAALSGGQVFWTVTEEGGIVHRGAARLDRLPLIGQTTLEGKTIERRRLVLPSGLAFGYHRLDLIVDAATGSCEGTATLINAPSQCYMPEALAQPPGIWGFALQLYGLTGRRSWGMGDFGDLGRFVGAAAASGAGAVGLNPTNALFLSNPAHASPYSPSSRAFLNPLYIEISSIPDLDACGAARGRRDDPAFQAELAAVRHSEQVDYVQVAALKLPIFEMLYATFTETQLARSTDRAAAFRRFQQQRGPALEAYATFEALSEHFRGGRTCHLSWRDWPPEYRSPDSNAVTQFRNNHADRLLFFQYLQWEADRQMGAAAAAAAEHGMPVGLYRDLALGSDPHGADAWLGQQSLALAASMGAPPDPFNRKGQNWGLPPFNPMALRNRAYRPFIDVLRANMRHAGALRIDHILGFARLFWIPQGASAGEGGYVRYPLADFLAITALESQRARCAVIGEDLGTVAEGLRERLQDAHVLSCRLLYFEREANGTFRPPEQYPALSQVAVGTHDLPPLPGYWCERDIDIASQLDLLPNHEAEHAAREERARSCTALVAALRAAGRWPETDAEALAAGATERLVEAVYAFLARTPGRLLMVQPEDVLGVEEQTNLPGTVDEHPNWRRKLPIDEEDLTSDPRVVSLARLLCALRRTTATFSDS